MYTAVFVTTVIVMNHQLRSVLARNRNGDRVE